MKIIFFVRRVFDIAEIVCSNTHAKGLSMENVQNLSETHEESLSVTCYTISTPSWPIIRASSQREWLTEETRGHANKCLPLLAANQMGWHILSPSDFTVVWDGGREVDSLKVICEKEEFSKRITSHFGYGVLTFSLPFLFKTSKDIGLFVRGPTNLWKDGAYALDGYVETFWSDYSFTMNWKIYKPNFPISFEKDEPVCMIIPYPVNLLENIKTNVQSISSNPELNDKYNKWSKYRQDFNENPNRGNSWQKDYFSGRKCPFSGNQKSNIAEVHKTRFNLPDFNL